MKLYCKEEFIAEVCSKEEADEIIKNIQRERVSYIKELERKVQEIQEGMSRFRRREICETIAEYNEYLMSEDRDFIVGMKEFAKEFCKDDYIDVDIHDSDDISYSIKIAKGNGTTHMPFELMVTKALMAFPFERCFRIEE